MAAIAACRNHADRDAIGVCVKCRARVCAECSTKVDGINHCVTCLAALAGDPRAASAPRSAGSRGGAALAAGALLVTGTALAWALLEIALPG